MVYIRKGYNMPGVRTIKGIKYHLDSLQFFGGDRDRRLRELRAEGRKVKTFTERHEGDNTGAWVIYTTRLERKLYHVRFRCMAGNRVIATGDQVIKALSKEDASDGVKVLQTKIYSKYYKTVKCKILQVIRQ